MPDSRPDPLYHAIVVGAGPAGLSAALVLGRCRRNVLIVDDGRPRNSASPALHGFLSRDGIHPGELRRLGAAELARYDTVECRVGEVVDAVRMEDVFLVSSRDGSQARGRKLILATGLEDEVPALPGFDGLYGRGVFHCPYCDGWEVRDQVLGALARGEQGVGLAEELTVWSRDVTLFTDGAPLDAAQSRRLERAGVAVEDRPIQKLEGDSRLESVTLADGARRQVAALFFGAAQRQRSPIPARLGCAVTEEGVVPCAEAGETSVPGLYIVGDASRRLPVHFAIAAAAEGAESASSINARLLAEDLGLA